MGSISKSQPELWNTSREPCLLFLHSSWMKLVKICLLTLVILDCLRASKSCLCLREVFLSCLSRASAQPQQTATEFSGLLAFLLPVPQSGGPHVSPQLCFLLASALVLPQRTFILRNSPKLEFDIITVFLYCIRELGWIKIFPQKQKSRYVLMQIFGQIKKKRQITSRSTKR